MVESGQLLIFQRNLLQIPVFSEDHASSQQYTFFFLASCSFSLHITNHILFGSSDLLFLNVTYRAVPLLYLSWFDRM
jgi:hypothetical protein